MGNFPWTQEEINEWKFKRQYESDVNNCAETIINTMRLYSEDYMMDIFMNDVFKIVRKEIKKIGEWR